MDVRIKIRKSFIARARASVLAAIAVAFLNLAVFPATVAEYRERLQLARSEVESLIQYTAAARKSGKRETNAENGVITEIRKDLPASEKIEWKGSAAETGNQWLHARLEAFQAEGDAAKRVVILNEADERIGALLTKLDELDKAAFSERTKDEDKQKLDDILGREEYKPPEKKEESLFAKWWREFTEWLDGAFPRPNVPESSGTGSGSTSLILQILVYALVIGGIGFLAYKFVPGLFGRYAGRVKKEKKDRLILGEQIAADESAESLFGEAERLARDGNLRAAIRKGYIALLCELSDRKIIGLAQHKTNRDYLRDVRSRDELYRNMNGMTTSFERHWYGFQDAEDRDWDEFRQSFRRATETRVS